jgi:CRP-like cAMP-binding protein
MEYSRAMARRSGDPKIQRLSQVQLFKSCSKRELARIAALSTELEIEQDTVLMRQGDPGRECFVIEKGKARATVRGKKRRIMGPGECFGEMALLHAAPRSATVTAETDMKLIVLGSREFWTLLEDVPRVALKVLAAVGERLRETEGAQPHH